MLISIAIPSLEVDVLKGEWSHALANKDGTARLLSVMQYDSAYQFGDVVRYGTHDEIEGRYQALDIVTPGEYVLHRVYGLDATPEQSMKFTDAMREQDLHIEVWSLTVRAADETPKTRPLRAGLALQPGMDLLEALLRLRHGARIAGVSAWCPTLSAKAGDRVGLQRDLTNIRRHHIAVAG